MSIFYLLATMAAHYHVRSDYILQKFLRMVFDLKCIHVHVLQKKQSSLTGFAAASYCGK